MLTYAATSTGSPEQAWRLLAEPARWHRWAPHIRGARGLGAPEVVAGRRGVVLLAPGVPVPARILTKRAGRAWTWRVGPLHMRHSVRPTAEGCRIEVTLQAPGPVELATQAAYGSVIWLTVNRLARLAAQADA